jgi:hypothetical protein
VVERFFFGDILFTTEGECAAVMLEFDEVSEGSSGGVNQGSIEIQEF